MEGYDNIFSVEFDPEICETYRHNFPEHLLIECDIKDLSEERIESLTRGKSVDVVIGGPPCQGFSMAGHIGRKFLDDPRNYLFNEFVRVVKSVRPKGFVMGNWDTTSNQKLFVRQTMAFLKKDIECFL